ncbi:hypothetical protein LTDYDHKI_CDS0012 [Exiguobacterium phage phiExGM16]
MSPRCSDRSRSCACTRRGRRAGTTVSLTRAPRRTVQATGADRPSLWAPTRMRTVGRGTGPDARRPARPGSRSCA